MSMKVDAIRDLVMTWDSNPHERISWNDYFMSLAFLTSSRSSCDRLHVGCVLVKNNRIVSMGYNGFMSGEEHKSVVKVGVDGKEHEMATIHAEQNAVGYGANTGVSLKECVAYITHYPCLNCAKLLCSCGITKVYYHDHYHNDPLVGSICSRLEITQI